MVVFDIGNTDIVIGFYKGDTLLHKLRIRSLKTESEVFFEYKILNLMIENNIAKSDFSKVVISSVVPLLTPFMANFSLKFLNIEPLIVNPAQSKLLKINIDFPEQLGSDLFVNALAALDHFKNNCIIVDFGTALTFTTVSKGGEILGVAILPGIKTAINALFSATSLLPEIKLEKPETVLGKDTLHAIRAGIFYGYEGLVPYIINKIKQEVGDECKTIATGGLSGVLKELAEGFDLIDKDLTLKGLCFFGKHQI